MGDDAAAGSATVSNADPPDAGSRRLDGGTFVGLIDLIGEASCRLVLEAEDAGPEVLCTRVGDFTLESNNLLQIDRRSVR